MCNLGVISLPFASGILGLTLGIWLDASLWRKFALLFPGNVSKKSQKANTLNMQIIPLKTQILKIAHACIKINDKPIRLFLLFCPLYWNYLATENSPVYK
jgi:hypothetical protein